MYRDPSFCSCTRSTSSFECTFLSIRRTHDRSGPRPHPSPWCRRGLSGGARTRESEGNKESTERRERRGRLKTSYVSENEGTGLPGHRPMYVQVRGPRSLPDEQRLVCHTPHRTSTTTPSDVSSESGREGLSTVDPSPAPPRGGKGWRHGRPRSSFPVRFPPSLPLTSPLFVARLVTDARTDWHLKVSSDLCRRTRTNPKG